MKGTDIFKRTIHTYLVQRAASDELFAEKYANPKKSIDDCVTYILNTVKKSGCNGFADDEIYSMAVHYYDEDNIEVGKPMNADVVVNHVVELSEEEKEQARKEAIQRVQNEAYNKMTQQPKKRTKQAVVNQPSLFD
ncbi:PcfK-like family protein [Bacteroides sp. 519]|uniref:PcfK-like family protein n=1 Tax=Bacteroides sp. 519 TaxID=2302937 RepID=UPI0013D44000|nr:PcfK-like family protein [Bacteroides sp. 519]NDV57938.1 PcfK-like protein [Bacteroides sp. 519]